MTLTHDTQGETYDESGAVESDTSLDALAGTSVELPPAVRDFVTERPMAAALASAAVGAGVVALLLLLTRDNSPGTRLSNQASRAADRAADKAQSVFSNVDLSSVTLANLKQQVADLASRVAASLPSASAAADTATSAASGAADNINSAARDHIADLRTQTRDLMDKLQPYVGATADLARANPVWASIAVGALGALLGSQLLGGKSSEAVARKEAESAAA